MPWETRKGKGSYYTRSRRVNGKVVREYLGSGSAAEQAALDDALERLRRSERRRKLAIDQVQQATQERKVKEYCQWVEVVVRAELVAAGYHSHRGEWRKRREPVEQPSAENAADSTKQQSAQAETDESTDVGHGSACLPLDSEALKGRQAEPCPTRIGDSHNSPAATVAKLPTSSLFP